MIVLVELEVQKCSSCPHYKYDGESWEEDIYICQKTNNEVEANDIHPSCPFIEKTMEKLRNYI